MPRIRLSGLRLGVARSRLGYTLHQHQASFRDVVLTAYGGRCAISRLPKPRLLDAANIVMDAHEQLGQPIVSNGLPLSNIHHAAFDANQEPGSHMTRRWRKKDSNPRSPLR
jgi:HNH endonuclease